MNPLRTFTGNMSGLFPSLSTLDATGIVHWKPEREFLRLRMLQRIIGLTWSAECTSCLFFRKYNGTGRPNVTIGESCYVHTFGADVKSPLYRLLKDTQFDFKCENDHYCSRTNYHTHVGVVNVCWDQIVTAINCQSSLGGLSVVFNFVTFFNIITSKRLRKNVCMLLVCNMAFSDFLTGLYTIAVTIYLNVVTFIQSYQESAFHCWKIGMFWMLGQASAFVTSFYLTLERYLAIVFSLQPEVRITRRLAAILIMINWIFAGFLTVIALYYNFYMYTFLCIPIRPDLVHPSLFAFTLSIGIAALILYGISFGFYVHIYFTVKRAAQDAGVKQESKLAKRIALLVFSNVFFFVLPVLSLGMFSVINNNFDGAPSSDALKKVFVECFPMLCLSLNSCINPVLHAFRNDSFREVLKGRFSGLMARLRSFSSRISPGLQGNSKNSSQNNEISPSDSRRKDKISEEKQCSFVVICISK